ncbi:MAG: hypothetical protein VX527_11305 [Planctomycetota bacterium]|nr:hypothetical protein [Planctomycetota bacterium]
MSLVSPRLAAAAIATAAVSSSALAIPHNWINPQTPPWMNQSTQNYMGLFADVYTYSMGQTLQYQHEYLSNPVDGYDNPMSYAYSQLQTSLPDYLGTWTTPDYLNETIDSSSVNSALDFYVNNFDMVYDMQWAMLGLFMPNNPLMGGGGFMGQGGNNPGQFHGPPGQGGGFPGQGGLPGQGGGFPGQGGGVPGQIGGFPGQGGGFPGQGGGFPGQPPYTGQGGGLPW